MKIEMSVSALNGEKKISLDVDPSQKSLLDLMESGGARMPFGCRAGSCGVCRVKVRKGLEGLTEMGVVEEDTHTRCKDPPEIRLACQVELKNELTAVAFEISIAPEVQIDD